MEMKVPRELVGDIRKFYIEMKYYPQKFNVKKM